MIDFLAQNWIWFAFPLLMILMHRGHGGHGGHGRQPTESGCVGHDVGSRDVRPAGTDDPASTGPRG